MRPSPAGSSPRPRGAPAAPKTQRGNIRPGPAGRVLGRGQAVPERTRLILVGPAGRELAWEGSRGRTPPQPQHHFCRFLQPPRYAGPPLARRVPPRRHAGLQVVYNSTMFWGGGQDPIAYTDVQLDRDPRGWASLRCQRQADGGQRPWPRPARSALSSSLSLQSPRAARPVPAVVPMPQKVPRVPQRRGRGWSWGGGARGAGVRLAAVLQVSSSDLGAVSSPPTRRPPVPRPRPRQLPGVARCRLSYPGPGARHGAGAPAPVPGLSSSGRGQGCRCPGCRAARCARSRG